MRCYKQRGAVTLLVTSLLLAIALILTLSFYKTTFYQIKRAQNEVKARQEYWIAEGGIECIYSKTLVANSIPTSSSIDECNTNGDISFSYESPREDLIEVTSDYGYASVTKIIKSPGKGASGVIKATSNLYFAGGLSTRPDPSEKLANDDWACTLLRYSKDLLVNGAIMNQGLDQAHPPYQAFPTGLQKCDSEHVTVTSLLPNTAPTGLKEDFVKDEKQTPFKDLFDTPRDQWFDIMSSDKFTKIAKDGLVKPNGEMKYQQSALPSPGVVTNCGDQITSTIKNGGDLIWVYGSCHLDAGDLTNIGDAISPPQGSGLSSPIPGGVILVVHNGLFSTAGALTFKGMIYHFVSNKANGSAEFVPSESKWAELNSTQKTLLAGDVSKAANVQLPATQVTVNNTAYYQQGSFFPVGGYVMDAPGTYAVINSSLSFSFNQDVIAIPLSKLKEFKWKAGSWYAD